jgi:hypothetical protein
MRYEHTESESAINIVETDQYTVNGYLSWRPSPYVSPSLGYSESKQEVTGQLDRLGRSYSLTVATAPLKTLRVSLGATRTETYIGDEKTATSDTYTVTTSATIYPDLQASWNLSQFDTQSFDSEGQTTNTTTNTSRFQLNARLTKKLIADLTLNYTDRKAESDDFSENTESSSARVNLQYRPSDLLALRGNYVTNFTGDKVDSWNVNVDLGLLRTDKARLTMNLNHRQAEQTSDRIYLNGSWDISKNLSLITKANYTITDVSFYAFEFQMNLRL